MKAAHLYIWTMLDKFGFQAFSLLTNMILARFLSPKEFGTIGILMIFIGIASVLTDAGLGGSLINEKKISKLDCSTIFVFNILISSAIYIILWFLAPFVESFYNISGLSSIMRILCLIFVINSFSLVSKTMLMRTLQFKKLCIISLFSIIFSSFLSIITALNEFGVYSLVVFSLSQSIISTLLIFFLGRYKFPIKFSMLSFRKLYRFGLFTTLENVLQSVYENLLAVVFGKFYNVSQVGYYTQAKKMETGLTGVMGSTINSTSFPVLSRLDTSNGEFQKEALSLLKMIESLIFPLIIFIISFSDFFIVLIFGSNWIESSLFLKYLLIAGLFLLLEITFRTYVKSLGAVGKLFKYALIKRTLGIFIVISLSLISCEFALIGYVLSCVIGCTFNIYLYSYIINETLYKNLLVVLKYSLPSVLLASLMFIVSLIFSQSINLIVDIILISLYYLICISILFPSSKRFLKIK